MEGLATKILFLTTTPSDLLSVGHLPKGRLLCKTNLSLPRGRAGQKTACGGRVSLKKIFLATTPPPHFIRHLPFQERQGVKGIEYLEKILTPPVKGERATKWRVLKKGGCQLADRGVAFKLIGPSLLARGLVFKGI